MKTIISLLFALIFISCVNEGDSLKKRDENGLSWKHNKNGEIEYLKAISSGVCLSNKLFCTLNKKDSVNICDLVKDKKQLFYYYNEVNCSSCVDSEIERIQKYNRENCNKIIVVARYSRWRDYIVYRKISKLNDWFYAIKTDMAALPIQRVSTPFYFSLNKEGIVMNIFIPDTNMDKYTNMYVRYVGSK